MRGLALRGLACSERAGRCWSDIRLHRLRAQQRTDVRVGGRRRGRREGWPRRQRREPGRGPRRRGHRWADGAGRSGGRNPTTGGAGASSRPAARVAQGGRRAARPFSRPRRQPGWYRSTATTRPPASRCSIRRAGPQRRLRPFDDVRAMERSKTISGDAVLPSQPQLGGDIVIVDRGNGALTFVDPAGCFIARQIAIPGGARPIRTTWSSCRSTKPTSPDIRPTCPPTRSWPATTSSPSIPTTGGYLRGSTSTRTRPRARCQGAGAPRSGDHRRRAGGRVAEPDRRGVRGYGDGGVVVIDPARDKVVAGVSLPGLSDCEGMDFVAASHLLLVACGGDFGRRDQPLQSGIAVVDLGATPPRLERVVSSVAFNGHPDELRLGAGAPTATSPNRAFAATYDPKGMAADAVFEFDFASGAVTPVTRPRRSRSDHPRCPTSCCSFPKPCPCRRRSS